MSEIATTAPRDPAHGTRAIQLGREGYSVREIAVALGLSLAQLQARQDEDADFDEAMVRAEEAARAWWEGLPRAALAEGRRFDHVAWREAMRARFGDEAAGAAPVDPLVASSTDGRGFFVIPCNGRERRPDGSCPYMDQDTSLWPRRWFDDGDGARYCDDDTNGYYEPDPEDCTDEPYDGEDDVDDGEPADAG